MCPHFFPGFQARIQTEPEMNAPVKPADGSLLCSLQEGFKFSLRTDIFFMILIIQQDHFFLSIFKFPVHFYFLRKD